MALIPLTQDEREAFLQREGPALSGAVSTIGADGLPHVVPVWYRWDGARVHIWTLESRAWVQNVLRDPRAAFTVFEQGGQSLGASLRGRAEVVTGDGEAITREIEAITRRYVPDPAGARDYIARWQHLRTIVSLTPSTISAWRDG